jgi:hypothetical protein
MSTIPFDLTVEEEIALNWQYQKFGGFYTSLMDTISKADEVNLICLSNSFPNHVRAYRLYVHERGWWERVQEKARVLGRIVA